MIATPTAIDGVLLLDVAPRVDERGSFARLLDVEQLRVHGLAFVVRQQNLSTNPRAGTVRGLHLQRAPHEEAKLVRCVRGAILDVAVDVRPGSPTWGRHVAVEVSAANQRALLVPPGCAHGFQTLADDTAVEYLVTAPYAPDAEDGYRHDDPAFGIEWPLPVRARSAKDAAWPLVAERGTTGPHARRPPPRWTEARP